MIGVCGVIWLILLAAGVFATVAMVRLGSGHTSGGEGQSSWLLYTIIIVSALVIIGAVPLLMRARRAALAVAEERQARSELALRLFRVMAEIIRNLEYRPTHSVVSTKVRGLWLSRDDFRRIRMPVLRGTAIGSALGVLPGGGHILAAFTSYSVEKRISKHPEKFGRGAIEGVASPESANNAAAQTSFIPLLTLGLPAHPVMALLVGAFIIQGITPGPNVINDEPELFWGLIASFWVGNLLLVLLNLPLIGLWVRLISVPSEVLLCDEPASAPTSATATAVPPTIPAPSPSVTAAVPSQA
jgi:hypothetical protein